MQVIQERVPLRRSGTTWKGLCPFHGEKTPSFHVYDKGFFKCYGCGVGGDVIKFVELYDKVAFPEAVRQLAVRAGLPVPEPEASQQDADDQRDRESCSRPEMAACGLPSSWPHRSGGRPASTPGTGRGRRPSPHHAALCAGDEDGLCTRSERGFTAATL